MAAFSPKCSLLGCRTWGGRVSSPVELQLIYYRAWLPRLKQLLLLDGLQKLSDFNIIWHAK